MNYSWSKTEHILRWSLDGMKGFGYFSYIFAEIVNLFLQVLFCETLLLNIQIGFYVFNSPLLPPCKKLVFCQDLIFINSLLCQYYNAVRDQIQTPRKKENKNCTRRQIRRYIFTLVFTTMFFFPSDSFYQYLFLAEYNLYMK